MLKCETYFSLLQIISHLPIIIHFLMIFYKRFYNIFSTLGSVIKEESTYSKLKEEKLRAYSNESGTFGMNSNSQEVLSGGYSAHTNSDKSIYNQFMLYMKTLRHFIVPAAFIFLNNLIPTSSDAYSTYIADKVYIKAWEYGFMGIMGQIGALIGALIYWRLLRNMVLVAIYFHC